MKVIFLVLLMLITSSFAYADVVVLNKSQSDMTVIYKICWEYKDGVDCGQDMSVAIKGVHNSNNNFIRFAQSENKPKDALQDFVKIYSVTVSDEKNNIIARANYEDIGGANSSHNNSVCETWNTVYREQPTINRHQAVIELDNYNSLPFVSCRVTEIGGRIFM